MTTDFIAQNSAELFATTDALKSSTAEQWVMAACMVATDIVLGNLVYKPEGNKGKGSWKGGSKCVEAAYNRLGLSKPVTDPETGETVGERIAYLAGPTWTIVSEGIRVHAPYILAEHDPSVRREMVRRFCEQRSFASLQAEQYPPKEKRTDREALSAIVADMFKRAVSERNGYTVEEVVAEVLSCAEYMLGVREG